MGARNHPSRAGLRALLALLAVTATVTLTGCGAAGGSAASGGSNAQTLTVYSSLPLQGATRQWSQSIVNAEKLALEQSGGEAGSFRVSYVSLDDSLSSTGRWDPGQTSSNARMATQDKSTIAYLGEWDSGATAISLPLVNGAGLLQISPGASYEGLTRTAYAGKGEPDRYYPSGKRDFARLVPVDEIQAAAQLAYMRAAGVRRLFVLTDDDVFDAAVATIVAARASTQGIQVVGQASTGTTESDLRAALARATSSAADGALFGGAPSAQAVELLRGLHAREPRLPLFVPYFVAEPGIVASLGSAASSLYVTSPALDAGRIGPGGNRFALRYRQKFGTAPGPWAAYGYEAMRLVLDSIRTARGRGGDHAAVIDRALSLQRRSVLGDYSFDGYGDTTLTRFLGQRVRHGALVTDRVFPRPVL